MCLAVALTLKKTFPVSKRAPGMAPTQGYQKTWPLQFACYHQSDPQMASLTPPLLIFQCALCGHHLEKGSKIKLRRSKCAFWRKGGRSLAKVGQAHIKREWVSSLVNDCMGETPLRYPSHIYGVVPLHTPLHIFAHLCFLSPPPLPSLACTEARVKFTTTVKVRDDR